ncbi:hypothetical protein KR018_012562, partial [Drosophila ironensis]
QRQKRKVPLGLSDEENLPAALGKCEGGRPKLKKHQQLLEKLLHEQPLLTSMDMQQELMDRHGINLSRRTLQRRIREIRRNPLWERNANEVAPDPQQMPLSLLVRNKRLAWATDHENWTVRDWRHALNIEEPELEDEGPAKEIYEDTLLGPQGTGCQDLNFLELAMAIVMPCMTRHNKDPQNSDEFRSILNLLWRSDQEMVDKLERLFESMSSRVMIVLRNGGHRTGLA